MASHADIYTDLAASAAAAALVLNLPAALGDDSFEPPIDGNGMMLPYLRFDFMNNAPFWEGIRSGRLDQGMMQITLTMPRPHLVSDAYELVDDILALYPKAGILPGDGRVKVQSAPWVASPIVEGDRTYYPITVPWVC